MNISMNNLINATAGSYGPPYSINSPTNATMFATSASDIFGNSSNGNSTAVPSMDPPEPPYGLAETVVMGIFLGVVMVMGFFGNILVIVAIRTDRRLRKRNNWFLVSLAIADLFVCVLVMTFAIPNDIMGRWVFHRWYCKIWLCCDVMGSTASILNLCVISMDRYLNIRDPYRYDRFMSIRKVWIFIALVWVLSGLISFLPFYLEWHVAGMDPAPEQDTSNIYMCFLELSKIYAVVSSLVSFYIPCIVMLVLYGKVYAYARSQVKAIKKTMTSVSLTFEGATTKKQAQSKMADHKATITLGIIMGVFLLCWGPFFVVNIVTAFCSCMPGVVFQVLTWLGYFNSAMNPVIYSTFNMEFRNAFIKILKLRRRCPWCFKKKQPDFLYGNGTTRKTDRIQMSDVNSNMSHTAVKNDEPLLSNGDNATQGLLSSDTLNRTSTQGFSD